MPSGNYLIPLNCENSPVNCIMEMFLFLLIHKGEVQDNTEVGRSMAQPNAAGELNAVALETALLEAWKQENAFQASIDSR